MNRCGEATPWRSFTLYLAGEVKRFLSIHLFSGVMEEVVQTEITLSSWGGGFTQHGAKPNWLCFIGRPARGKWMSEECVCRCYRLLNREALFHNGVRGWDKMIACGKVGNIWLKALLRNTV